MGTVDIPHLQEFLSGVPANAEIFSKVVVSINSAGYKSTSMALASLGMGRL